MQFEKKFQEEFILSLTVVDYEGAPLREKIITEDEILNLQILLNTETDFDALIRQL